MISFANPSWLYGLLGLLIPIGIHLLSRKEGKTIYIGSIRHLTDSDTAQFSSIRLNEIILLILRMILITLLVFILAGFNLKSEKHDTKQWLIIEKGIEQNKDYSATIDNLKAKGFEIHWLADGIPDFSDSSATLPPENYFKLVSGLPSSVDTAVVISYSYSSRFKGEKIALPKNVFWLTVDSDPSENVVAAVSVGADSLSLRTMKSNLDGTSLKYSTISTNAFGDLTKIDSLEIQNPDTIEISIYATEKFDYDKKIIQAALLAIAKRTPHKLVISIATKPSEISIDSDFIFWLSDENFKAGKSKAIGYVSCEQKNILLIIARQNTSQLCKTPAFDWIITQRLNEENVLKESFSYSLAKIVLPKSDEQVGFSSDHRSFPSEAVFTQVSPGDAPTSATSETTAGNEPILAILLFIILVMERAVAHKRNQ